MRVFTWRQRFVTLSTTLAVIGFFALVAYGLTRVFNWSNLVIMVAVVLSFPVSQLIIVRLMKAHLKRYPPLSE